VTYPGVYAWPSNGAPSIAESRSAGVEPASCLPELLTGPRGALTACVLALLLTVAGLLAPRVITEIHRQTLITEIEKLGSVEFGGGPPARWGYLGPLLPRRFGELDDLVLGDDRAEDLTGYDFYKVAFFPALTRLGVVGKTKPDQLLGLPKLDQIEQLALVTDGANDAVVRHVVKTYPKSVILAIESEAITDASIAEICRLEESRYLFLGTTKISASALRELQTLKHLESLELLKSVGAALNAEDRDALEQILPVDWRDPVGGP
jgi:hypothetical protein